MVKLTNDQKNAFKLHASSEILTGHNTAWAGLRADFTKQHEPFFVAHLCASLSRLAIPWGAELMQIDPNAYMSICSVFTHQRPYITYTNESDVTEQCELADVMIALIDRSDPSNVESKCLFVQAKRDDSPTVTLNKNEDLVQLRLYQKRPPFNVLRATGPQSIKFPTMPDTSLNYGITPPSDIKSKAAHATWGHDRWRLANDPSKSLVGNTVNATIPLQDLLADLLDGSAGSKFALSKAGDCWDVLQKSGDSWSALINYILQDIGTKRPQRYARHLFNHRSSGELSLGFNTSDAGGHPWLSFNSTASIFDQIKSPIGLDMFVRSLQTVDEPADNDPPRTLNDGEYAQWGGISVVVIEMSVRPD